MADTPRKRRRSKGDVGKGEPASKKPKLGAFADYIKSQATTADVDAVFDVILRMIFNLDIPVEDTLIERVREDLTDRGIIVGFTDPVLAEIIREDVYALFLERANARYFQPPPVRFDSLDAFMLGAGDIDTPFRMAIIEMNPMSTANQRKQAAAFFENLAKSRPTADLQLRIEIPRLITTTRYLLLANRATEHLLAEQRKRFDAKMQMMKTLQVQSGQTRVLIADSVADFLRNKGVETVAPLHATQSAPAPLQHADAPAAAPAREATPLKSRAADEQASDDDESAYSDPGDDEAPASANPHITSSLKTLGISVFCAYMNMYARARRRRRTPSADDKARVAELLELLTRLQPGGDADIAERVTALCRAIECAPDIDALAVDEQALKDMIQAELDLRESRWSDLSISALSPEMRSLTMFLLEIIRNVKRNRTHVFRNLRNQLGADSDELKSDLAVYSEKVAGDKKPLKLLIYRMLAARLSSE